MTFRSPAEASGQPPRPSAALLDAIQKQLLDAVTPALDAALGSVDDYLFDRSQSGEDALGMMALREMRRARAALVDGFRQATVAGFAALRIAGRDGEGDGDALSLLSDQDLEQQLAVEQLADAVLRGQRDDHDLLGKRLAAVAGRDVLLPRENPASPSFLAGALGNAMTAQDLDAALRIVAFKFFERELGSVLPDVYDHANQYLARAGVLPELRAEPRVPQRSRSAAPRPPQDAEAHQHPHHPQHAHAAPEHPGYPPQGAAPGAPLQVSIADQAMFASMLGLLQGWRQQSGAPAPTPSGPTLASSELLSILSLMQRDPGTGFRPSADDGGSLATQLRTHMADNARKLGVSGDNLNLDGLDNDAVDLVALLFDVLLDGPQFDTNIRQKIGRMLVPYVKVAVKDRRMFLFKEHPARRLLNTVAEACEGNHGKAPQDRELLTRVDHTIDRLVAEFNEDVAIFEVLEQELRGYMAQHRKRFELAERRSTEAQHGRERLHDAREAASADLDRLRDGRQLPFVVDDFLNRHVTHHLIQSALRDGTEGPRYQSALATVTELLDVVDAASRGAADAATRLPVGALEAMLVSAGCTGDAGEAATGALRDAIATLAHGDADRANQVRMPEQAVVPEPAPLPPEPKPRLEVVQGGVGLDCDKGVLARTRALVVGDWIQLANQDGDFEPAKVSWVSPISGRLLLVNRRGIRVLVASVEELAVMATLGKVLLREGQTAFEDAMHQVAGRLKNANQPG